MRLKTGIFYVKFLEMFQVLFFTLDVEHRLLPVNEVKGVIQTFLARQLLAEVASLLQSIWLQVSKMIKSICTVRDDFTRNAFAPVIRVQTGPASDVACSFAGM